uniref:Fibrillar collagen NC1 domain-containing protein n=2 Tax=Hippocampus comes TaxID=109280 RepID=A0A3Q3DSQ8_HIPCM
MKFLHLLSSEASQSIGLHCRRDHSNSTADGFSSPGLKPTESSNLRFRGWNNQMFETDSLLEPYVLKDECKIQDGSWHQSHFFFHTQESHQLPIVDIVEIPTPGPNVQRHIEVGPVCFL